MSIIYLIDPSLELIGPVELPEVPGLGVQRPGNAIDLALALPQPKPGYAWGWIEGKAAEVPDLRGEYFDTQTGEQLQHNMLGALPDFLTDQPRPSREHSWADGKWELGLESLHTQRTAEINAACEQAIVSGFCSAALGHLHVYSSQLDDQLNLTGAILRGLDMPYACRDEQGVKAFRLHTAAQLRQVGDDFTLYKLQLLQHANELKQQLDLALAAGNAEAIAQIRWEAVQP